MNFGVGADERRTWAWISAAFGLQAAGAVGILYLFGMSYVDVRFAISILCLGALSGFLFMFASRAWKLGSWQWWVPPLLYALFIYALSDHSYPDAQPSFSTKFFHPVEYLMLTLFLCVGWMPTLRRKGGFAFAVRVLCTAVLLALSDEFHQSFTPGRTPQLSDVFFWDLIGISLALSGVLFIRSRLAACTVRSAEEKA